MSTEPTPPANDDDPDPGTADNVCPACLGTGMMDGDPCGRCNGDGIASEGIGGG